MKPRRAELVGDWASAQVSAGGGGRASGQMVADPPGGDRAEGGSEHVHREEVERHRGPAQRGFHDVLDGGIDRGVVDVHHRGCDRLEEHEAPERSGGLGERERRGRHAHKERDRGDEHPAVRSPAHHGG